MSCLDASKVGCFHGVLWVVLAHLRQEVLTASRSPHERFWSGVGAPLF